MTVEPPEFMNPDAYDSSQTPSTPAVHDEPPTSDQWKSLSQDQLGSLRSNLVESIIQVVVQGLTGAFLPGGGVGGAFDQLEEWAEGIADQFLHVLGLDELLAGLGLDPDGDIGDLFNWATHLLDFDSPLNAANLFGSLIHLLTRVPSGSLTNERPNLLPNADVNWTVTFNGRYHALRSGVTPTDRIAVGPGQAVTQAVTVDVTAYSGVGDPPILLQVMPFADGVMGAPVTVASYAPVGATVAGYRMSGEYEVPDGIDEIQFRILVTDGALSGSGHFTAASLTQQFDIQPGKTLTGLFDDLDARRQALLDAFFNKFTGSTGIGHNIAELVESLDDIPAEIIRGLFGTGNIRDDLQAFLDAAVGGLVGQTGTGSKLPDLETFLNIVSGWAKSGSFAWDQAAIRNNQPVDNGLVPSERSNFPLSAVTTNFTIVPGTAQIDFDYVEESMPLGVISWIGWGITGITEFYVNVYDVSLDGSTPVLGELLHQSPNVVGILGGAASPGAYMSYELDDPVPLVATQLIAYERITVGGNHTVTGRTLTVPVHPTAPIGTPAATRTVSMTDPAAADPLMRSDVAWAQNVGRVSIAVDTGSGSDHHDPVLEVLTTPTSLPVPNWADFFDVVYVSKGGDAANGVIGFYGNPGRPGSFNVVTYARGTHFDGSSTIVVFDGSSVSIPGYSITAPNGANGSGQTPVFLAKPVGKSPGPREYNGISAITGADQTALGANGTGPGVAGNGGTAFGLYSKGGIGGASRAWIQFRKDLLPGETPSSGEGDTTPPDITGMTAAIESTYNSITLTPSGAIDA